jgi:hypothetical protein
MSLVLILRKRKKSQTVIFADSNYKTGCVCEKIVLFGSIINFMLNIKRRYEDYLGERSLSGYTPRYFLPVAVFFFRKKRRSAHSFFSDRLDVLPHSTLV